MSKLKNYKFTDEDKKMLDGILYAMAGEDIGSNGLEMQEAFRDGQFGTQVTSIPKMQDFLATPSAQILLPKVVLGTMREVSEPIAILSKFFTKIRMKTGYSMVFPSMGTVARAYDVAEGQEIPEETLDWQAHEGTEIKIGKVGLRLRVTDEMISDSQWDIVSMMVKAAGRAMIRHKERKASLEMIKNGHRLFDNKDADPEMHTRGLDINGVQNNSLSAEDLLDSLIALMSAELSPTDLIMHPLAWSVFARNELTGGLRINNSMGGLVNSEKYPKGGSFKLGPDSIAGRLPFAFNVNLTPYANLNKQDKTFDLSIIDKSNVGVHLVKTDLSMEKFDEPARDIQNMKFTERYNFGVLNQGKGIVNLLNISLEPSYPQVQRIKTV